MRLPRGVCGHGDRRRRSGLILRRANEPLYERAKASRIERRGTQDVEQRRWRGCLGSGFECIEHGLKVLDAHKASEAGLHTRALPREIERRLAPWVAAEQHSQCGEQLRSEWTGGLDCLRQRVDQEARAPHVVPLARRCECEGALLLALVVIILGSLASLYGYERRRLRLAMGSHSPWRALIE